MFANLSKVWYTLPTIYKGYIIMLDYKIHIASQLSIEGLTTEEIAQLIVATQDDSKGDYSLPCFRFAKILRLAPQAIAQQLAESISIDNIVDKVEAVAGYVNVFVNKVYYVQDILQSVLSSDNYGSSDKGKGKTICIDYSSVNIAKSLHIGHLGTTAIGSSLYKIYQDLGYNVVGINHLGDYGTQFGKMIVAYRMWGDDEKIAKDGAKALQEIYVKFHQEEENNPALTEEARQWFVRIEKGDAEAQRLFQYFKDITLKDVKATYAKLGVDFDSWDGESFFNDKMEQPLAMLESKGLITVSDGAKVVDLEQYNMPPCLLVKSDGSSLYATRDIAAAMYRKQTYNFDKCLYVVASHQNLHFQQFFKVLQLAGLEWAQDLVHVSYGMLSIAEGAMSTRKGNTIFLEDVINMAVEKSLDIIESKNPNLANKQRVAQDIGVGAVLFSALENSRIKDVTFSYDRILSFEGETAPYLQYTHARCCSLFEKAGLSALTKIAHDMRAFDNIESLRLAKLIAKFPSIVEECAAKYEPSILSKYLIDLAQSFNKFYFEHRILSDNLAQQNARLIMVDACRKVLAHGLSLLGISAPEKM